MMTTDDMDATFKGQQAVFDQAMAVYVERTPVRQDRWRKYPPKRSAEWMLDKAERIMEASERGQDHLVIDDALDIINFAAFFIRGARARAEMNSSGPNIIRNHED